MDRSKFDSLTVQDQLQFVNGELKKDNSLTQIAKRLNMSRSTLSRRFEKVKHKYDGDVNQYIGVDDKRGDELSQKQHSEANDKKDDKVSQVHEIEVFKGNNELLLNDNKEKLIDILENYDKIKAIIEHHDKVMTSDDKSNLVINLPYTKQKDSRQTLRINPVIAEEFEEFCKRYESFSKKELLSQALKEFMQKYK